MCRLNIIMLMLGASIGKVIAEVSLVQQIQNGLIAHYSFDQDWTDSSGTQRNLTIYSSSIKNNGRYGWDPDSGAYKYSGSADFSASTDARADYYKPTAPSQNLTGFTFATWIKINNFNRIAPNEWSYFLGGDVYNGLAVRVSVAPDYNKNFWVLSWPHSNGFPSFDGTGNNANLLEGNWYHIAVTHDSVSNLTEFFFNGEKKYEFTNADPAHLDANNFYLGNAYHRQYNAGEMDDVRVYDRALSSSEVGYLAVPEPSALSLLAVGLGVVLLQRRRTV